MTDRIDETAREVLKELVKNPASQSAEWLAGRSYEIATAMERERTRRVREVIEEKEAARELETITAPGRVMGTNVMFRRVRRPSLIQRIRELGGF